MATKTERLQKAWHKFDNDKDHKPTGTRQAVEWAVAEGLIELPDVDPYDVLAEQMSQAYAPKWQRTLKAVVIA